MKKIMLVLCAGLAAIPLLAQNVKVGMSGPSGQGDFQIKKASDGTVIFKADASGIEMVDVVASQVSSTKLIVGGIDRGVQSVALGTNETASVTITASQVDITGPTNAAEAVVTLGLPSASQLGQFVGIRNVGTSTVQVVYTSGTTNELATTKRSLLQSVSTSAWEVIYTTP